MNKLTPPEMALLFVENGEPCNQVFQYPKNGKLSCKPTGGLWASPYLGERFGSDWVQWCLGANYDVPEDGWDSYLLYPNKDSKIYVVDDLDNLEWLCRNYDCTPDHMKMDGKVLGWSWIDFERISNDFDAIYLTERGQWATRYTLPYSLYGWDCETFLALRWVFGRVEHLGRKHYAFMGSEEVLTIVE